MLVVDGRPSKRRLGGGDWCRRELSKWGGRRVKEERLKQMGDCRREEVDCRKWRGGGERTGGGWGGGGGGGGLDQ